MSMKLVVAQFKRVNSKKPKGFCEFDARRFSKGWYCVWRFVEWAKKEHNRQVAFCLVGNMEF